MKSRKGNLNENSLKKYKVEIYDENNNKRILHFGNKSYQ